LALHAVPLATQQLPPSPHSFRLFVVQLVSAAQSALEAQPHAPPLHFGPGPHVAVQLVHAVPPVPQASSPPPAAHVPELQHPPLHMVWLVPRHAVPHWWAFVSHA
jgi:hypothetical protein